MTDGFLNFHPANRKLLAAREGMGNSSHSFHMAFQDILDCGLCGVDEEQALPVILRQRRRQD